MTKILFICHGNICRSPMAQSVMTYLVKQAGLEREFVIDSAATSWEEEGSQPHHGTRRKLQEVGVPLVPHRAVRITKQDYQKYDLIIGMDQWNIHNIERITGRDKEGKLHLLLEFAGETRDIADPWYTGNFDATYRDVLRGCQGLLEYCINRK